MRILVTGASGFLGSSLAIAWTAQGHTVRETSSGGDSGQSAGMLRFRLGEPFDARALEGIDVVLHGAHAFGKGTFAVNVLGTQSLFEAARAAGVRRQIFVSSTSARSDTGSEYGRIKFTLEQFFIARRETVVRPGLVIGPGGRFGRIVQKVLQYPVIPLLDASARPVPIVGIADFVSAMTQILDADQAGVVNLFNAEAVPMRRLLETLVHLSGRRRLFVAVPPRLAESVLVGAEWLRIPLPVDSGSVRAMKQDGQPPHRESDLRRLIGNESPVETVLAEVLEAFVRGSRPPAARQSR